jgi:hypothetical protein
MFPEDWEVFMPDILAVIMEMYREGLIQVTQNEVPVDTLENPGDQVRISGIYKPK